jgi:hypothetical protein
MGWYGGAGACLYHRAADLPGRDHGVPVPDPATGLVAAAWPVAYTVPTDATWTTGVYLVKLTTDTGDAGHILFVLRDDGAAAVLYHLADATYQAYNGWGGKSLYEFNSAGGRAVKVAYDRPYDNWAGAGRFFDGDYSMIRWLEQRGYDVAYASSADVHAAPGLLARRRVFLANFHDEYWSAPMRARVTAARDAGTSLAFFAANSVYWQIRFEPAAGGAADRVVVCYKPAEGGPPDPITATLPALTTTRWRDAPVAQPENGLLGVMQEAQLPWDAAFPWVVTNAGHWVYAGTGLQDGAAIPGVVGYEFDRVWDNGQTPPGLAVLAASPVAWAGGASVAHGTVHTAASGALVFAAGTNKWAWKLDDNEYRAAGADPRLQRITANLLDRMLTTGPPGAPPPRST